MFNIELACAFAFRLKSLVILTTLALTENSRLLTLFHDDQIIVSLLSQGEMLLAGRTRGLVVL